MKVKIKKEPKYKVGDTIESSLRVLTIKEIKKEKNKYRYVTLEDGETKDFTFSEDYLERYFVLKDTSMGDPVIVKDIETKMYPQPLRIPITKEIEELVKQIDKQCLKNSFWDKEKIEYNTDETLRYYGEVNLELSNNATNPNHYNQMKIQPNEYITANKNCFSWYTANVIKYVSRYKSKNGIEDLEKAIKNLQFEIEELRKNQEIQDYTSRC